MITFALICLIPGPVAAENKAYVKDGKIVVETPTGVNELDYSPRGATTNRYTQKWSTREENNPAQDALKVFQDKSKPYYHKRVWFVDDGSGIDKFYVDVITDSQYVNPFFLPYDNYAYYLGYSPSGVKGVYGVNLSQSDTFFVDQASKFEMVTCPDNKSYVVVHQDGALQGVLIYDYLGKKIDTTFDAGSTLEEIQKALCP